MKYPDSELVQDVQKEIEKLKKLISE